MKDISNNLQLDMNVTVQARRVVAELKLCNLGDNKVIVSDDALMHNSNMYSKYPFTFSDRLGAHCETDSSGYTKNKMNISGQSCLHKTWEITNECNFDEVKPGNYTVTFAQVVDVYFDNSTENTILGASSNFIFV